MNNFDLEERSRRCIQSAVQNQKIYANSIPHESVDRWYALAQTAYEITSHPTTQHEAPKITIQLPWQEAHENLRTYLECRVSRASRH